MRLSDFELVEKLRVLLSTIVSEGRISKDEATRIAFYALYNNSCANMNCYDIDENLCKIDPQHKNRSSAILLPKL